MASSTRWRLSSFLSFSISARYQRVSVNRVGRGKPTLASLWYMFLYDVSHPFHPIHAANRQLTVRLHFRQVTCSHVGLRQMNSFSSALSMTCAYGQLGHVSRPSIAAASTSLVCCNRCKRLRDLADSKRTSSDSGKADLQPDMSMQRMAWGRQHVIILRARMRE
jgi:hypothetical protein